VKKSLAAIASAFLVTCAPAFSQTAATPDPATVAAVKEMLVAMHARELMAATVQKVKQDAPSKMRYSKAVSIERDPALDDKQKSAALVKLDDSLRQLRVQLHAVLDDPAVLDEMLAVMVPLYADTYTVDEIHQMTAFYNSPVGQKMLAKSPELMGRSVQAAYTIMMPRITPVMAQYAPAIAVANK
jgi:hypothetical protein